MPPMKIQPIDSPTFRESSIQNDTTKPVVKSRLKRFFDRPFPSVLRISSAAPEKPNTAGIELPYGKDGAVTHEFEPSSVCLAKMVQNFIEENNTEKPSSAATKCGRNRCNCFNGNNNDSSDDEFDFADSVTNSSFGDSSDTLKSLIPCASVVERNLLADTSKIVEKNKACKRKDDLRKIVTDELLKLGYNASICKSKWEKASSVPGGEYEYIDVIVEGGERVLIDVDFRSEFEIARSTGSYKAVLQSLPFIFVGKSDRLLQIVSIVSEAARLSLKKKGMHIAPWRKAEYIKAKWFSPHIRTGTGEPEAAVSGAEGEVTEKLAEAAESNEFGELDLIFGERTTTSSSSFDSSRNETKSSTLLSSSPAKFSGNEEQKPLKPEMMTWQPPALKPKSCDRGNKIVVTGLASLLREKP